MWHWSVADRLLCCFSLCCNSSMEGQEECEWGLYQVHLRQEWRHHLPYFSCLLWICCWSPLPFWSFVCFPDCISSYCNICCCCSSFPTSKLNQLIYCSRHHRYDHILLNLLNICHFFSTADCVFAGLWWSTRIFLPGSSNSTCCLHLLEYFSFCPGFACEDLHCITLNIQH